MCRRIKVDLSKFYNDARMSSLVYVDGTNITFIHELQKHIGQIFDIREPFHLLLNGTEYLPPAENARLVEPNERVLVVPGSGYRWKAAKAKEGVADVSMRAVQCDLLSHTKTSETLPSVATDKPVNRIPIVPTSESASDVPVSESLPNIPHVSITKSISNGSDVSAHKPVKNGSDVSAYKPGKHVPDVSLHKSVNNVTDDSMNESVNDHLDDSAYELSAYKSMNVSVADASAMEATLFHSIIDDSQMDSASESKATDSNVTEDYNVDTALLKKKRKRVRRKKSKHSPQLEPMPAKNWDATEMKDKKPKIVSPFKLPSGNHIRFSNIDDEESTLKEDEKSGDAKVIAESNQNGGEGCYSHFQTSGNLSTLLALGQSSTPITFDRKKIDRRSTLDDMLEKEIKKENLSIIEESSMKEQSENSVQNKFPDPQKFRESGRMITRAEVKDVISFKILKMSSNYTPEISDTIVAEVVKCSPTASSYTFKILEGADQIQAPQGKFDLQIDEDENECSKSDSIVLDWAQLIEPKLLYTV